MKVGIVGASGYSGEVLVKLLLGHPQVTLTAVTSRQHAGKPVAQVIPALRGTAAEGLKFSDSDATTVAARSDVDLEALHEALERLAGIHHNEKIDVLIPCLDAELPLMVLLTIKVVPPAACRGQAGGGQTDRCGRGLWGLGCTAPAAPGPQACSSGASPPARSSA